MDAPTPLRRSPTPVSSGRMRQSGMKISFAGVPNETAFRVIISLLSHHYLESWGDVEPKRGHQPDTPPLRRSLPMWYHGTRQAEESLLRWAGIDVPAAKARRRTLLLLVTQPPPLRQRKVPSGKNPMVKQVTSLRVLCASTGKNSSFRNKMNSRRSNLSGTALCTMVFSKCRRWLFNSIFC